MSQLHLNKHQKMKLLFKQTKAENNNIEKYKKLNIKERQVLEDFFQKCEYPNKFEHIQLACKLGTTSKRIKTWFQNRRIKKTKLYFKFYEDKKKMNVYRLLN